MQSLTDDDVLQKVASKSELIKNSYTKTFDDLFNSYEKECINAKTGFINNANILKQSFQNEI